MKFIITLLFTVLLAIFAQNVSVFAQFEYIPSNSALSAPDYRTPEDFVGAFVNLFLGIAISVSVLGILFSGIKIAWSKGDAKSTASAKEYLNYAVRGLLFSLAAVTIEYLIRKTIGATGDSVGIGLPK